MGPAERALRQRLRTTGCTLAEARQISAVAAILWQKLARIGAVELRGERAHLREIKRDEGAIARYRIRQEEAARRAALVEEEAARQRARNAERRRLADAIASAGSVGEAKAIARESRLLALARSLLEELPHLPPSPFAPRDLEALFGIEINATTT
jgi:hypothetical protein